MSIGFTALGNPKRWYERKILLRRQLPPFLFYILVFTIKLKIGNIIYEENSSKRDRQIHK